MVDPHPHPHPPCISQVTPLLSSRKYATCVLPELSEGLPLSYPLFVPVLFYSTYLRVFQIPYSSSLMDELQGAENLHGNLPP
jgi:hypothetical protein